MQTGLKPVIDDKKLSRVLTVDRDVANVFGKGILTVDQLSFRPKDAFILSFLQLLSCVSYNFYLVFPL